MYTSITGSGRSPGEGIGYPLQDSWASLVAQSVKNLPAIRETWVQSLGWEDPLEEGMATHSNILEWRIPMDRGAWRATVHGVAEWDTTEWLSLACISAANTPRCIFYLCYFWFCVCVCVCISLWLYVLCLPHWIANFPIYQIFIVIHYSFY